MSEGHSLRKIRGVYDNDKKLRRLAQRLSAAGISYKVVGSTCLALHGMPLTPGDIDVETDAASAYRIQALWPDAVVELDGVPVPLAWLEGEALAYVRRDRLERMAQCLPYCDRDRLLALFRREVPTAVI